MKSEVIGKFNVKRFVFELLIVSLQVIFFSQIWKLDAQIWVYFLIFFILLVAAIWRLLSYKIEFDGSLCFKKFIRKDLNINFEEVQEIKLYIDVKKIFNRSFLEITVPGRYYVYHLDYFNTEEVSAFIESLSHRYDFPYIICNE